MTFTDRIKSMFNINPYALAAYEDLLDIQEPERFTLPWSSYTMNDIENVVEFYNKYPDRFSLKKALVYNKVCNAINKKSIPSKYKYQDYINAYLENNPNFDVDKTINNITDKKSPLVQALLNSNQEKTLNQQFLSALINNKGEEKINTLIKQGADVNSYNCFSLKFAVSQKNNDLLKLLLNNNADVNTDPIGLIRKINGYNWDKNLEEATKILFSNGLDIHTDNDTFLWETVHWADIYDDYDKIEFLLKSGANPIPKTEINTYDLNSCLPNIRNLLTEAIKNYKLNTNIKNDISQSPTNSIENYAQSVTEHTTDIKQSEIEFE